MPSAKEALLGALKLKLPEAAIPPAEVVAPVPAEPARPAGAPLTLGQMLESTLQRKLEADVHPAAAEGTLDNDQKKKLLEQVGGVNLNVMRGLIR